MESTHVSGRTGEYDYLWDGSEDGWVVLRGNSTPGTIYNTKSGTALVIEDDDAYERVIESMREHGRPFLDSMP